MTNVNDTYNNEINNTANNQVVFVFLVNLQRVFCSRKTGIKCWLLELSSIQNILFFFDKKKIIMQLNIILPDFAFISLAYSAGYVLA